jgi:hypothetical protein
MGRLDDFTVMPVQKQCVSWIEGEKTWLEADERRNLHNSSQL